VGDEEDDDDANGDAEALGGRRGLLQFLVHAASEAVTSSDGSKCPSVTR
jgi:hypothetical protein